MAQNIIKTSPIASYKYVLVPLFTLVGVIALGAFVYNFATARLSDQSTEIAKQEKDIATLSTKVATLQEGRELLKIYEPLALAALPPDNPVLLQLFRLKQIASQTSTSLQEVRVGALSIDGETVSAVSLSYSITGTLANILDMIDIIRISAPIVTVTKMEIDVQSDDLATAEIATISHYSALPESLPPITSPISRLSRDEINALNSFEATPVVANFDLTPQRGSDERNPFAF